MPLANLRAGQVGGRRKMLSEPLTCVCVCACACARSTSLGRADGGRWFGLCCTPQPSGACGFGEVVVHCLFLTAAAKMSAEDQVVFTVFSL